MNGSSTRAFRAAVVQTLAKLGDIDANIELVERYTEEAARQGANLVVFPECMNSGYLFDSAEHCRQLAESLDGVYCSALRELCRRHNIFIASGFTERDDNGLAYNSALLFNARGELICHYQKQFLATHDQNWFEVGTKGNPVVDTELGRIGLLICFDGRIPEIARCLAAQGAEIVLDMANFFVMDQAEMWVPARAYENGVWFVAATKAGVERSIYYPGGSMIVSPDGDVLAQIPYDAHGVVSADVVLDTHRATRWSFGGDKWRDRRPDAYRLLTAPFPDTPLETLLAERIAPEAHTTKVAAVQAHVTHEHSLDDAMEMVEHACQLGVKLLALPLNFGAPDWCLDEQAAREQAILAPNLVARLSRICARYDALAVLPCVGRGATGKPYLEALLVGPEGVIGRQRQVHPGPRTGTWTPAATDRFAVFDTRYGRLGILVDYDGMFPESSRVLALMGAEIIVWCVAWEHPAQRRLLSVPKAEDNRVYVVCANRTDAPYPGGSFVVPPQGFPEWNVERAAAPSPRWGAVMPAYANLALTRQKRMIPGVDMVRNRLVDTYNVLTDEGRIHGRTAQDGTVPA
ncbi:carbon-nitrogen hydrolase family protein [Burkholderia orbicola]|uniref:carbon-nitrogen hydrolase family protein n=1 Tax=Burkholderia orbicola TaxID=2978683 RepID=UPI0026546B6A|nr:carbon-nitrogen hydrolase family protein [Burkholderia orbicola]MDN7560715.1 carbon-nitrogen hydrolase family protein [Burkholderia orbicola]